jgi:Uma2 family endonuclease
MNNQNPLIVNPLAVIKPNRTAREYTLAAYLKREERAKASYEYYNGVITKRPASNGSQNIIAANAMTAIMLGCRANSVGEKFLILASRQLIYLPELNSCFYPEVSVVAEKPICWDNDEFLLTNPHLIVEVLPKATRKQSRYSRFYDCIRLPSFQEYVLIHPEKCHIEVHFREDIDLWRTTIYTNILDIIILKSMNCTIEANLIYSKITFKK